MQKFQLSMFMDTTISQFIATGGVLGAQHPKPAKSQLLKEALNPNQSHERSWPSKRNRYLVAN